MNEYSVPCTERECPPTRKILKHCLPDHSGAQAPSHHKTQRASSRTNKNKITVAAQSCSTEFKLVICSTRQFIRDPRHSSPQPPQPIAFQNRIPESHNSFKNRQFPTPALSLRGPKICPSEMTLRHTWFDVHLLMEGPLNEMLKPPRNVPDMENILDFLAK